MKAPLSSKGKAFIKSKAAVDRYYTIRLRRMELSGSTLKINGKPYKLVTSLDKSEDNKKP